MTSAPDHEAPLVIRRERPRAQTLVAAFLVLAVLSVWRLRAGAGDAPLDFLGTTMGTTYSVRVDAELSAEERGSVRLLIEERLERVNHLMSNYDTASELSRFNRHASTAPFPASAELLEVLGLARDVSERSGGAFDVTVAPFVEAWGFGLGAAGVADGRLGPRPDEALLARLRERVGYDKIVVDRRAGTVSKTHPETTVDLSAIAKGYGVARVAQALLESGLSDFLVEVGGELEARGTHEGRAWRVGIERPDDRGPVICCTVELSDEAIATSGDYRSFHEGDGVRYSHIIDPRTGAPTLGRGVSVSVVHPSAAAADAWATALTVLGPEDGYELARAEGLAALFVQSEPETGGFRSLATPALEDRFVAAEVSP